MSSLSATLSLLGQLSDATRLRILSLVSQQELSVAELVKVTQLAQPRISTHLGKLKEAQIVVSRREGSSTFYRLNESMPAEAATLWAQLQKQLNDQVLARDAQRLHGVLDARQGQAWPETVAGQMERHYSPGRSWQAMSLGMARLLCLGEVLDIGAGDGALAQIAGSSAKRWVCLDQSATLLDAAKKRLSGQPQFEFVQADMHELPFERQSFDQVLHFHALTYATDPKKAIEQAARVLRPGGTLVLLTLAPHNSMEVAAGYGHRQPGFSPSFLLELAAQCGLCPQHCEPVARESSPPFFELVSLHATAPIAS